jgi:hypothetical protein
VPSSTSHWASSCVSSSSLFPSNKLSTRPRSTRPSGNHRLTCTSNEQTTSPPCCLRLKLFQDVSHVCPECPPVVRGPAREKGVQYRHVVIVDPLVQDSPLRSRCQLMFWSLHFLAASWPCPCCQTNHRIRLSPFIVRIPVVQ